MIKIKTFESFMVMESTDNKRYYEWEDGSNHFNIYGPKDGKGFLYNLYNPIPEDVLRYLKNKTFIMVGKTVPPTSDDDYEDYHIKFLVFNKKGIEAVFDERSEPWPNPVKDKKALNDELKVIGPAGDLIAIGIMDKLPYSLSTFDKLEQVIKMTKQEGELDKRIITVVKDWMIKQKETPVKLMSWIRSKFLKDYEAEFGKDDMAADMGDLGF
jgi:hypothetical protein